ncbi:MAG: ABC transporter ATP-binding protein [Chloroflexota bacterium]|nr:ABC transporter ATP-binding protein [Chloroflexota bacterium]
MPTLIRLVKYALTQRALVIVTAVVMVASIVPRVALPRLVGDAVDALLTQGRDSLVLIAGLMVAAGVARAVLGYLGLYLAERVGRVTEYRLRNDFVDKLQWLNFGFFDRQKTGDLMSRATVDIDAVDSFISTGVMHGIAYLMLFFLPVVVMLSLNWQLGLIAFVGSLMISGYGVSLAVRLFRIYTHVFQETGRMNTALQESLTGIRTVKVLGAQDYEQRRYRERASAVAASFIRADRLAVTRDATLNFLYAALMATILLVGGWQVQRGVITAGTLATFVLFLVMLGGSIRGLEWRVRLFSTAMAAGKRIFEVLDTRNPLVVAENARELSATGHVEFDSVSFAYTDDVPALHDVSFGLRPGQSAAIVGGSGSGKSTIAHLLPRFYDASAGRITIDGVDVRDVTLESLRRSVGIVMQDVFVFSATIRDNIAYGVDDASMEDVIRAARAAQLHDFIESLPDGYDTWVGERGATLSGGQRQRLAIARTLLLSPPILILDDSTSSVDVATEALIQQAMVQVLRGRTSFVIAHRLSTVRRADLILVLDQGRIVEQGAHDDLMRLDGYYRRIHDLQLRPADELRGFSADA